MSALPGFKSYDLTDVPFLLSGEGKQGGNDVYMTSGQVSGITPDHRHPPGTVIVKRTSTGKYVLATDANADHFTPAVVTAAETGDTDWDGTTLTVYLNGDLVATVLLAGTDDTDAEVAAALEAAFLADQIPLVASVAGSRVVVTSHVPGSLRVESTLATAYANAGGAGSYAEDVSDDPDVRVTAFFCDLKDFEGTATDALVPTYIAGHFDESELEALTAEAKAVLRRRGSRFE